MDRGRAVNTGMDLDAGRNADRRNVRSDHAADVSGRTVAAGEHKKINAALHQNLRGLFCVVRTGDLCGNAVYDFRIIACGFCFVLAHLAGTGDDMHVVTCFRHPLQSTDDFIRRLLLGTQRECKLADFLTVAAFESYFAADPGHWIYD